MRCLAASICGASSSRFFSSRRGLAAQIVELASGVSEEQPALRLKSHGNESFVFAGAAAPVPPAPLRCARVRSATAALARAGARAALRALLSSSALSPASTYSRTKSSRSASNDFEAVRIVDEISEQHVMFEEEMSSLPPSTKRKRFCRIWYISAKLVAEKGAAGLRERGFLHFAPDAAERFAHLADNVLAVGLNFGDLRAHHVGLLAVLEKLAARRESSPCTRPGCSRTGCRSPG